MRSGASHDGAAGGADSETIGTATPARSLPADQAAEPARVRTRAARFAQRLLAAPTAAAGLVILLLMTMGAILAPLVSPYDPLEMHMRERLTGPSGSYWLGTDETGRDLLSNLLHAGRVSILAGLGA